jgi:hypothetical protein
MPRGVARASWRRAAAFPQPEVAMGKPNPNRDEELPLEPPPEACGETPGVILQR